MRLILVCLLAASSITGLSQADWVRKNGPEGGAVIDLEVDPTNGRVYALVEQHPYVSDDNGASWAQLYVNDFGNYYNDIEISGSNIYLIGTFAIDISTDGGENFVQGDLTGVLSGAQKIRRLSNGNLVALASNGTYTSTNNGMNWTSHASGFFNSNYLVVNSADQVFVISQSGPTYGLPVRSDNGGLSFVDPGNITLGGTVFSLAVDLSRTTIYAVNQTDILSSTDATFWTSIKGSISDGTIASFATNPSFLFFSSDGLQMFFADNANNKLWSKTVASGPFSWSVYATAFVDKSLACLSGVAPTFMNVVFGTFPGIYSSADGGGTVTATNQGLAELRATQMAWSYGALFVSTYSSGLYQSSDNGTTWDQSNVPGQVAHVSANTDVLTPGVTETVLALTYDPMSGLHDLYRSQNGGFSWTVTPVDFEWVSLSQNNRVYALNNLNSIYYSHNNATTWSTPITVTSLPVNIDISQDRIYMASSTRMLVELYNYDVPAYQYWNIDFVPGVGATATASATQVTLPLGTSFSKLMAKNGNFYQYKSFPSPDQFAFSSDGGANWITRSLPTNLSNFFVADNGYILVSDQNADYIFISSDDGATYSQTTIIPSTASSSNIEDIILDPDGFGYLALDGEYVHRSNRVLVLPSDPTGLTTTSVLYNAIALQWDDNASTEDHYQIERSVGGGDFSIIANINGDDMCETPGSKGYYVDTNVAPSTSYEYRVTAVNDAGVSASLSVTPTTPAACAPDIPDGRSWTATNAGGNGYAVAAPLQVGVRHLGSGLYEVSNLTMSLTGSPAQDRFVLGCSSTVVLGANNSEELRPNGTGTWNGTDVITVLWRECGSIDKSEIVTLTLNPTDPAPSPPTGIQALVTGNSSVEISWTTAYYEKDYIVEKSIVGPASGFSQVGVNVAYPNNKLTDNGPFTEGAIYYYRITARNNNAVPLSSSPSIPISLTFRKPNFIVSANEVSDFIGSTIGSYWGDFDNDGLDDLLTLNVDLLGSGLPGVYIFKNLGGGAFQTTLVDVEDFPYGMATVVDYDNDGNLDLAMFELDGTSLDLYQGHGDLTFTMLSPGFLGDLNSIEGEINGVSWSDVNNDGTLDVLILAEGADFEVIAPQLFLRNGTGSYTKHTGGDLEYYSTSGSIGLFADYDNDGNPDVLIVDGTQCVLYKGEGNANFTLQSSSGIDPSVDGAISAAWGDYNSDGFIDLYVGHSNNALYENNGDGTFTQDLSTSVTEGTGSFVIAPTWADFNNDGLLDLITPGYISGVTRIYINTSVGGTTSFTKITTEKMSDSKLLHWGASNSDYDKDGFVDVSMAAIGLISFVDPLFPANSYLYKNINTTGNWSEVRLVGAPSNSHAIGAQVIVQAGTKTIMREVQSPSTTASQNSINLHFGLGTQPSITSITVKWPSGATQVYASPPINIPLTIPEDSQGPSFTLLSPAIGTPGVLVSPTVEITFDEPVIRDNSKEIRVTRVSDGVLIFHQSVSTGVPNGDKYRFTFGSPLGQSIEYEVSFDAGAFTDIYGNAFTGFATPWRFTTTPGPQVTLLSPLNGDGDVPSNTNLSITFDVPTTPVAGKFLKIFLSSDMVTPIRTIAATIAVPSGNIHTFTIDPNIPTEAALTVIVDAGAFKDADNAVSAVGPWAFTTMAGPKVITLAPVDEAGVVPANTTLTITFDQPVTAEAGKKIRLFKDPVVTPVFEADVTTGVIGAGNTVTFTPDTKLAGESDFTVTLDDFAFMDAIGNLSTGIGSTQWNFTTDQGPSITGYLPANGAGNVLVTAPIEVTFNRLLVSAVNGKKLQVLDGATVVYDVDVGVTGIISTTKYTVPAPVTQWPAGKLLTVTLEAGAFVDAGENDSDGLSSGSYSFTIEVGPVVLSLSPADDAIGVPQNKSLEITFDKNISAAVGKTIRVMDGVTEVVNSNVSTIGTIDGAKYNYPAPAGGWPLDKVLTVLLDGGAFVDAGAKPSAAISGTQWTFRTVITPDITPPVFATFNASPYAILEKGFTPFTVSVTVTDQGGSVAGVTLFHRKVTEKPFQQLPLTLVSGNWEGSVSNAFADDMGFEYYFEATDPSGNISREPAAPNNHQSRLSFSTANTAFELPNAGTPQSWKVISIPYVGLATRQIVTLFQVLGDVDKKKWRMLTYTPDPPPKGAWAEYPTFNTIERGKGYFVNTRNTNPVSITLTGAVAPLETRDNLFQMQLTAGWNQIGNPYTVTINWNDARTYNASANLGELKVYIGGYANGNELLPGQGGFVFVQNAATISVPFAGQTTPGRTHTFVTELDQPNWKLPLTLMQDGIENKLGAIGMHPEALTTFDELDDVTPPKFLDFLEIKFDHPEFQMGTLSRDVVSTSDEYTWAFEVGSNLNDNAVLRWDNTGFGNNGVDLFLFDVATSNAVNMREGNSYEFDPQVSRKFKIYFGSDGRSRIRPEQSLLGNPHPNPTSGISYIPFALPEGNSEYGVKIEVFDLMGRKSATLEDGKFAPGLYETQWISQETHSNGLYSVRMTVVTGSDRAVYIGKILLSHH